GLTAGDARAVDDDDRGARIRVDVEEAGELDAEPGLFERLALRGVGDRLTEIDEPAGKRPQAPAGIDRAPRQQDSSVLLGNRAGHHLRIEIEDEAAARAHRLLALIGWHCLATERSRAERTEPNRLRREHAVRVV